MVVGLWSFVLCDALASSPPSGRMVEESSNSVFMRLKVLEAALGLLRDSCSLK